MAILSIQKNINFFLQTRFYPRIVVINSLEINILKILKKTLSQVTSSNDLALFIDKNLTLSDGKNLHFTINISPINDRININNSLYYDIISQILDKYMVENKELFFEILKDSKDFDTNERNDKTEIVLYKPYKQGIIYNFKQFKKIINWYFYLTKDPNIYSVPWKKLISFNSTDLNFNFLSDEIKTILHLDEIENKIYSNINELDLNDEEIEIFKHYNIKFMSYKLLINIFINDMQMKFLYNIKTKKAKNFEIYFREF